MSRIRGLAEVVLTVQDMQASVAFYRDILGLRVVSPEGFKGPTFLQAGSGRAYIASTIVLAPASPGTPPYAKPQSLNHIGLEVDAASFDAEVARLQGLGLEVRFGKHPLFPSRTAYVDDPDGNAVELICPLEE
jgi:catechol 2,3-dioxygenase-like lactoylglutathione lyase family enzyme